MKTTRWTFGLTFLGFAALEAFLFWGTGFLGPIQQYSLRCLGIFAILLACVYLACFIQGAGFPSLHHLSLSIAETHSSSKKGNAGQQRPLSIPRSAREAYSTLSDREFELFAAALIVGMGDGYKFVRHCGQSGDGGVDAIVHNSCGMPVFIQAKRYDPENATIGPDKINEFMGALTIKQGTYGYFVTTASFTAGARILLGARTCRVRGIDGEYITGLLHMHGDDIDRAFREIASQSRT